MPHRPAFLMSLLVGFLALGACAPSPPMDRPDVLLLTLDTLRGDHWGCVGDPVARTPHADRLARRGRLYAEGRAPSPVTLPSHASVMTGLPPAVHGIRDNGIFRLEEDSGRTMAEALREAGWSTAAFVSSYPLMERFGLDRGFDHYDDRLIGGGETVSGHLRERPAPRTLDRLERWLRDVAPADQAPLFLWVHFFDPHAEYAAPSPWPNATASPYAGEVAFTDRQTGRLLRILEEARGKRSRIVAVAADHGEGLGQHGELTHGVLLHASTLRIPIVVAGAGPPGLTGTPVPLESLPGTLLESVGLDPNLNPLSAPPLEDPPAAVHAETLYPHFNFGWAGLRAREEDGWRLIAGPTDRLYRIRDDPGETRDVAGEHPDVVARLRDGLEEEWEHRRAHAYRAAEIDLAPEDIEALQALGYVGGEAGEGDMEEAFEQGADPGDRVRLLSKLNAGVTQLQTRPAAAAVLLQEVLEEDPQNRLALEFLGRAQLMLGRPAQARDTWERALRVGKNPVQVYLDLARAYRILGQRDRQRATLEAALQVDARSVPAHQALAEMALEDGRAADARDHAQRAYDLRPGAPGSSFLLARAYEALGDADEARRAWERVLELKPDPALARQARAALLGREGP